MSILGERFSARGMKVGSHLLVAGKSKNKHGKEAGLRHHHRETAKDDLSPAKGVAVAVGLGGFVWMVIGWLVFG